MKDDVTDYWGNIWGIKSLEFYTNDVKVNYMVMPRSKGKGRKENDTVREFTDKSRKRLAFVANNTDVVFRYMTTLTYPAEWSNDGALVKKHLNTFLTWMRKKNKGCEYLWFLEFQKRGAPHFHVLTDARLNYRDVAVEWFRIVGSGSGDHLKAGTRTEQLRSHRGGANYAVKYAQKMKQKIVPKEYENVGRFWGNSKGVRPVAVKTEDMGGMGKDDLIEMFGFWEYQPELIKFPMGTLYNVAGYYPQIMGME